MKVAVNTFLWAVIIMTVHNPYANESSPALFIMKESVAVQEKQICLSVLFKEVKATPITIQKMTRHCSIQLAKTQTILDRADVEIMLWQAGIIPDKLVGNRLVIHSQLNGNQASEADKATQVNKAIDQKIRRGSSVYLVSKSPNMVIKREMVLLSDSRVGDQVQLRAKDSRKMFIARLISSDMAELLNREATSTREKITPTKLSRAKADLK